MLKCYNISCILNKYRLYLFTTFLIFSAMDSLAQDEQVYTVADTNPAFIYGHAEFARFVNTNMRYPALAKHKNIEGTVYVSFVIDTNGMISEEKVLRDIGY